MRPSQIANQTVTQMWLYSNNLQGAVPEELVSLTSLRSLSLGSNLLDKGIPPEVWTDMTLLPTTPRPTTYRLLRTTYYLLLTTGVDQHDAAALTLTLTLTRCGPT